MVICDFCGLEIHKDGTVIEIGKSNALPAGMSCFHIHDACIQDFKEMIRERRDGIIKARMKNLEGALTIVE